MRLELYGLASCGRRQGAPGQWPMPGVAGVEIMTWEGLWVLRLARTGAPVLARPGEPVTFMVRSDEPVVTPDELAALVQEVKAAGGVDGEHATSKGV